jgi:tRNA pseudouridine55 synthase
MNKLLLVDKPKDWTSHDVVAKIRNLIKKQTGQKKPKVGHAGTLDPLATGLLIVLVGDYCKRAQEYSKLDKVYEAAVTLGQNSTTDDNEGKKTLFSTKKPSLKEIKSVVEGFVGSYNQTPPIYSAIKVGGKTAYKEARRGKTVVIEPRLVKIFYINNLKYDYPTVSFKVKVSSGTYIRSLARDIGSKLATGAYLSSLRRTDIGEYKVNDATAIDKITIVC